MFGHVSLASVLEVLSYILLGSTSCPSLGAGSERVLGKVAVEPMALTSVQNVALLGLGAKTGDILLCRGVFELWDLRADVLTGTRGQERPPDSIPQTSRHRWFLALCRIQRP